MVDLSSSLCGNVYQAGYPGNLTPCRAPRGQTDFKDPNKRRAAKEKKSEEAKKLLEEDLAETLRQKHWQRNVVWKGHFPIKRVDDFPVKTIHVEKRCGKRNVGSAAQRWKKRLLKNGFVWKCWVNSPNEIAIFHRDNDQQNNLGLGVHDIFRHTQICQYQYLYFHLCKSLYLYLYLYLSSLV